MSRARTNVPPITPALITASCASSWLSVDWTSVSGIARTMNWPWKRPSGQSVIRNWTPSVPWTVYGGAGLSAPWFGSVLGTMGLAVGPSVPNGATTLPSAMDPSGAISSTTVPTGK